VAGKDKNKTPVRKYKAKKDTQILQMPELQKHTSDTQRQGQTSGNLSEMREQIHEKDVRNEVPGGCDQ